MKSWKYGRKLEDRPALTTYSLAHCRYSLLRPRVSAPSFAARSAPREGADSL